MFLNMLFHFHTLTRIYIFLDLSGLFEKSLGLCKQRAALSHDEVLLQQEIQSFNIFVEKWRLYHGLMLKYLDCSGLR